MRESKFTVTCLVGWWKERQHGQKNLCNWTDPVSGSVISDGKLLTMVSRVRGGWVGGMYVSIYLGWVGGWELLILVSDGSSQWCEVITAGNHDHRHGVCLDWGLCNNWKCDLVQQLLWYVKKLPPAEGFSPRMHRWGPSGPTEIFIWLWKKITSSSFQN